MDIATSMNTQERSERISNLSAIGLAIAFFGMLFSVLQGTFLTNTQFASDQSLLVTLCWIAVGGVVVLFGISLVIAGQKKWA